MWRARWRTDEEHLVRVGCLKVLMERLSKRCRFAKVDAYTLAHNGLPIESLLNVDSRIDVI